MTTPTTQSLPIGSTLQGGKYEVEAVLGQGSFGITYLCRHTDLEYHVAIKEFFMADRNGRTGTTVTCSSSDGMYEKYRAKFRKEAQNLAKLDHPHIVKVQDLFKENDTVYYVMEYIDGGSLDEYIHRKGTLGEAEAVECIRQAAGALSYMHGRKMLHLDLKPSNIMRCTNGKVVLIDFGLSKQYDEKGKPETSTSIGGGTPGYAPIEQGAYHEGKAFAATMDVYALGATLYKLLVGKPPLEASDLMNEGFPANELKSRGVSDQLTEVIRKAMEPRVADRYQSVADLRAALPQEDSKIDEPEEDFTPEVEVTVVREPESTEDTPEKKKGLWQKILSMTFFIGVSLGYWAILVDNMWKYAVAAFFIIFFAWLISALISIAGVRLLFKVPKWGRMSLIYYIGFVIFVLAMFISNGMGTRGMTMGLNLINYCFLSMATTTLWQKYKKPKQEPKQERQDTEVFVHR